MPIAAAWPLGPLVLSFCQALGVLLLLFFGPETVGQEVARGKVLGAPERASEGPLRRSGGRWSVRWGRQSLVAFKSERAKENPRGVWWTPSGVSGQEGRCTATFPCVEEVNS